MASRRASITGKVLIKERRIQLGWNFTDPRWAIAFGKIIQPELDWNEIGQTDPYGAIGESSMRRFQGGKPIVAQNFNILCQCLDLDPNIVADNTHQAVVPTSSDELPTITDLIDMPKDDFFCGRQVELQEIEQWLNNGVPFLNLWGAAGIGKSSLMAHWVKQQTIFPTVIWQSVDCENFDISCKDCVEDLLDRFAPEEKRGKNCFQELNKLLSAHKILIVIDGNFNEEYRQWFKILVRQLYASCVVIISEPNLEVVLSNRNPQKAKEILGLNTRDVKLFWDYYTRDFPKSNACSDSIETLRDRYDGNPTLLNLVIESIKNNYVGNLRKAMDETAVIPAWFKESFLDKRFDALSDEEQQILIAMAGAEDKVSLEDIKSLTQQRSLVSYLDTLRRSSIVRVKTITCGKATLDNDESRYSISTLWRKYLQRRFLKPK
jgi:NB-ARC domain